MINGKKYIKMLIFSLVFFLPILLGSNIYATVEENDYLIMFDNTTSRVEVTAESGIKKDIKETHENINVVKATMTNDEAKELRKDEGVKVIIPDLKTKVLADEVTWSTTMMQAPAAWNTGYSGLGVKVAVLDTGIANHTDLTIVGRKDFITTGGTASDVHGHGTAVAGVIASKNNNAGIIGIAPNVQLYAVKVMDNNGGGSLSTVVSAIEWCIANGIDVANLSMGVDYTLLTASEKTYFTTFLNSVGQNALANNLLIVAAAGNDGNASGIDNLAMPARGDGFLAVGAVDSNKNLATFSSIGPKIDVVAPGVGIKTLGTSNNYLLASGTSFSSPNVAGLAALYMERFPDYTAQQITDLITGYTEDRGTTGFDYYYGNGVAKFQTYIGEIEGEPLGDLSGVYTIRSKNSKLLMDVYNGGRDMGTNVIQWPATGGSNQKWKFEKLPNGYYIITSVLNPTFSLDVYGGGTSQGTRVIQWNYHGGTNQQWKLIGNSDGTITFISRLSYENKTYYALDVYGGGKTAGVNVIQWGAHGGDNQRWYLDNVVQELPPNTKDHSGIYNIRSSISGLLMDVYNGGKDQGTNVIQWTANGGINQNWKFEKLSNGYYKVTSMLSGMSLDVYNGGCDKGNRVIQWPYHGGSNQQWRIIENTDGSISLMSKLSEENYNYFILDVFNGGTTPGVNVIQWSSQYSPNQKWILDSVTK